MLSDTMLTSEEGNQKTIDFSTRNEQLTLPRAKVVGLSQKIVKIKDGLFIGWAGLEHIAAKFIGFVEDDVRGKVVSADRLRRCYDDYYYTYPEDKLELSTITFIREEKQIILQVSGYYRKIDVLGLGNLTIIGSGAKGFLNYLKTFPFKENAPLSAGMPSDAPKIEYILSYIARTMNAQHLKGFGLDEGWGASFEILLSKGGNVYNKLDKVLFHSYMYFHKDDRIFVIRTGRRYFHWYINNKLVVLSQGFNEVMKCQIIDLPGKLHDSRINPIIGFANPQMVCTLLTNSNNGLLTTTLDWRMPGHTDCSVSPMLGLCDTIRVHPNYVRMIVEKRGSFTGDKITLS